MDIKQTSYRQRLYHLILFCWVLMFDFIHSLRRYLKVSLFYQKHKVLKTIGERHPFETKVPKVLVVIPHITSVEEAQDRDKAQSKIEKLTTTIDALLASFAHCQLTIVLKTVAGRHIEAYLPQYQIDCVQVQEEVDIDPMFIGFRCQDELIKRVDDFDWFIFLEDDILLQDSFFLEKLEKFNTKVGLVRDVLLPNRYELWEVKKTYIDLTMDEKMAWSKLSALEIDGVKFAECTNPHSGFFCLSKSQINYWVESSRDFNGKDLGFGGPRECSATYSLWECFSLYKPHPVNLNFLEVRHYDTKYSQLYPEQSPEYVFSSIKDLSKLH